MKRTLITVLGIIISVAMVTAVFTSTISFMKFMADIEELYEGGWSACFVDVSLDDVNTLKAMDEVKSITVQRSLGAVSTLRDPTKQTGEANANTAENAKCVTDFLEASSEEYSDFHIKLQHGRYPQKAGEVLVSADFMKSNGYNWKVGDVITLYSDLKGTAFTASAQYKVVGITDTSNTTTQIHSFITAIDKSNKESGFTAYVVNNKVDNGIWKSIEEETRSINADTESVSVHRDYLAYSGVIKDNAMLASMGGFAAVMLAIILVASVFMIYNSFAVSLQQRSRYLGMLASVGATKRQKRASVYFEGFILGLIGIPIGVGAGIGGIAITFRCVSSMVLSTFAIPTKEPLRVSVNWVIIVGSVIISALTILISSFIPAHRASKTTPIDALRQANTVKAKSKKLKSSKLVGKMFGYEGQLAMKNYKRNGKRSRTITSALAISIVLFLSVTYFTTLFSSFLGSEYGGVMPDVTISCSGKYDKTVSAELSNTKGVKSYVKTVGDFFYMKNSGKFVTSEAKAYKAEYDYSEFMVVGLDTKDFNGYCKKNGIKTSDIKNSSDVILVNHSVLKHVNGKNKMIANPYKDLNGKTLTFTKDVSSMSLRVAAQTTAMPDGSTEYASQPVLIMRLSDYFKTMKNEPADLSYSVYAPNQHEQVHDSIDNFLSTKGITHTIIDITAQYASLQAINTVVQVFVYGFITLITLIAIMNIINTISTSMEERRREFAMVKSVGLTPKSFKKMIYLESIYYGLRSLMWGLPLSVLFSFLMYKLMSQTYDVGFRLQLNWAYYLATIIAVFLVIGVALLYSTSKIKHDNIIETLKNDDI